MAYPTDLASALSGASPRQLSHWARTGVLEPEIQDRPRLYSYRDILALRAFAKLRSTISLQKIRSALATLPIYHLVSHPSEYQFATDGSTIAVLLADGDSIDLVEKPGQKEIIPLSDIMRSFESRGRTVVDLERPRPNLVIDPGTVSGWPIISGTRVRYDTIGEAVDGVTLRVEDVPTYWPSVSVDAATDAVSFYREVRNEEAA